MDTDDLVIIGNEFTMSVEKEFPQHPPVSLIDRKLTTGGLVPHGSSPAPKFANKGAWLCHGCGAWDLGTMHHEHFFHPKPHLCEGVGYIRPTNVEEQCQSQVRKVEPEPLEFYRRESPDPVVAQPPLHLSHRNRKSNSEGLDSACRFSPPVSDGSSSS
jgi:hypothetical protein